MSEEIKKENQENQNQENGNQKPEEVKKVKKENIFVKAGKWLGGCIRNFPDKHPVITEIFTFATAMTAGGIGMAAGVDAYREHKRKAYPTMMTILANEDNSVNTPTAIPASEINQIPQQEVVPETHETADV